MNSIQIRLKDIIMFNCLTMNRLDTQHPPSSDIQQVSQELMFHSSQDLMWKFHPMHGLLFGEEHQWLGVGAPFLEKHICGKKNMLNNGLVSIIGSLRTGLKWFEMRGTPY